VEIRIKKKDSNAIIPTKAHPSDAGMDLYVHSIEDKSDGSKFVCFGVAFEIPKGYMMNIVPRSSLSKYGWVLANSFGVVDSDYRGYVKAWFRPLMNGTIEAYHIDVIDNQISTHELEDNIRLNYNNFPYEEGDRAAQALILPVPSVSLTEVSELSETDRGDGGFGSTNNK